MTRRCALIFHGLSATKNEKGSKIEHEKCYETVKSKIIDANPDYAFDTFFHTWDHEDVSNVVDLYKPKNYQVEPRMQFNSLYRDYKHFRQYLSSSIADNIPPENTLTSFFSRFYSMWKSYMLMESQDTHYDMVIMLRFDVIFYSEIILSELSNTRMTIGNIFNEAELPQKKETVLDGHRIQVVTKELAESGVHDFFFIGNMDVTRRMSMVFPLLSSYLNQVEFYNSQWPTKISGHPICKYHIDNLRIPYDKNLLHDGADFALYRIHKYQSLDLVFNTKDKTTDEKVKAILSIHPIDSLPYDVFLRIGALYWNDGLVLQKKNAEVREGQPEVKKEYEEALVEYKKKHPFSKPPLEDNVRDLFDKAYSFWKRGYAIYSGKQIMINIYNYFDQTNERQKAIEMCKRLLRTNFLSDLQKIELERIALVNKQMRAQQTRIADTEDLKSSVTSSPVSEEGSVAMVQKSVEQALEMAE